MGVVKDRQPWLAVEIGTLAIHGLGRAFGQRAAASFEQNLPAALAARPADATVAGAPGPIEMPDPGRRSPEAFGRDLAHRVARALLP
jgi:plasmid stabilization system protein ParE